MKTLENLNVPKDTSTAFTFGTIQNETATQAGTPVIRELYGDILTNLWQVLRVTNIIPTGDEDSNLTQYQLLEALKKLPNSHNDIEQVLTLTQGTTFGNARWDVNLDLSILPNRYLFIARAGENYNQSFTYTFKGSGLQVFPASSPTGFSVNDEVLIVVDTSGVRRYSLTQITNQTTDVVSASLGTPLSFNDSDIMYYLDNGKIYTETPAIFNIQEAVRDFSGNSTLIVCDALVFNNKLFALSVDPGSIAYRVYVFSTLDLTITPTLATFSHFAPPGTNNFPYMFCDGSHFYFTNEFNSSNLDNRISKYLYDATANSFTLVSNTNMTLGFVKTTNSIITNNKIFVFIGSSLNSFDLSTGAIENVLVGFDLFYGMIFKFNGSSYYLKDEIASLWNI